MTKGLLLSMASALSIALGGIFYKKAITLNGSDDSILRYVFQLITMFIIIKYKKMSILGPKGQRSLLCARAFFGIFAVISTNFAIKFISPSDNIALSHTKIIMTAILARIFLKEKFNISHLFALILTIVGALLISKPSFIFQQINNTISINESATTTNFTFCVIKENRIVNSILSQFFGVVLALVGAFGSTTIHIIIKKLCTNKVYFAVSTIYGTYLGLTVSIAISAIFIITHLSHNNLNCELSYLGMDIFFGLIGGILAVVGHVLLNISLQYEDATKVSIVRTIDVLFSFIFQFIILNITPDWISVIGAVCILFSTFIVLFHKIICQNMKKKNSNF